MTGSYNFGPAAQNEQYVWGSERPGYRTGRTDRYGVEEWISFMKEKGIQRVCCLLTDKQLKYYHDGLLDAYHAAWGAENVLLAPVEDYQLAPLELLTKTILPFLAESEANGQKVLVHCAAGLGRTGHVLAAWLVVHRGMSRKEAFKAVTDVPGVYRDPFEALNGGVPRQAYDELFGALEKI